MAGWCIVINTGSLCPWFEYCKPINFCVHLISRFSRISKISQNYGREIFKNQDIVRNVLYISKFSLWITRINILGNLRKLIDAKNNGFTVCEKPKAIYTTDIPRMQWKRVDLVCVLPNTPNSSFPFFFHKILWFIHGCRVIVG